MKVKLQMGTDGQGLCTIIREAGDPKFRDGSWGSGESRLLYHAKQALAKQGYDFIKKRMWRDGHMVDQNQQYLRERIIRKDQRCLAIWNQSWAIGGAECAFNEGSVTLCVTDLGK